MLHFFLLVSLFLSLPFREIANGGVISCNFRKFEEFSYGFYRVRWGGRTDESGFSVLEEWRCCVVSAETIQYSYT